MTAGGALFYNSMQVRNQESGVPQLVAVSSAVGFGSLDLSIHSYSADWLYQALLYVFSGVIKSQIEEAVNNAMHTVSVFDVDYAMHTVSAYRFSLFTGIAFECDLCMQTGHRHVIRCLHLRM
jgi:hypothetical protein